jgi:uncharacterized membrane protein YfcA
MQSAFGVHTWLRLWNCRLAEALWLCLTALAVQTVLTSVSAPGSSALFHSHMAVLVRLRFVRFALQTNKTEESEKLAHALACAAHAVCCFSRSFFESQRLVW